MSKYRLDKIVVVDLEATTWPSPREEEFMTYDPSNIQGGQISEIIEIGACQLDTKTGEISQKTSYIIKPQRSSISRFCTELTTITQEQVDRGMLFEHAVNKFVKDFAPRNKIWASWGDYDRIKFQTDCEMNGVPYPFGSRHLNAKPLFSLIYGIDKELGLDKAINYLHLPFAGTHHRGHDDAYNTAQVLWKTLRK